MSKVSRNNLIRCLIFLVILGAVFFYLNQAFTIADSEESKKNFNQFYSEKENTLDGVYFGASTANRYWAAPKVFHETGMAIYNLGTTSQPLVVTKYLMEESEKTQNPKLFIVELRWAYKTADLMQEAFIRKVTDGMKFSLTKVRAINEAVDFSLKGENDIVDNKMDYYIPILKYHGRWNNGDLTTEDLTLARTKSQTKGFFLTPSASFRQVPQTPAAQTKETEALAPETEDVLVDLLDYCDTIDTEVLFVLSPHAAKEENVKRLNEAVDIVRDRGYTVLNFNTEEMINEVGIDWDKDFFNANHTNVAGAEKFSLYLADYIKEHYDIEDHRGDPEYKSWEESYEYYDDYTREKKAKMEK